MLSYKLIFFLVLGRVYSVYFDLQPVISQVLGTYDVRTIVFLISDCGDLDQASGFSDSQASFKGVPVLIVSRPLSINISHIINDNILSFVLMNNRTKDIGLSLLSSVLYMRRHSNYQSRIFFIATE